MNMDEAAAKVLAAAIGGEEWQSGGGVYIVALKRPDGSVVVFSDDLVAEYADDEAFEASSPATSILLRESPEEYWVIEDAKGDVWLEYPKHGRGWALEEDAQQEARGIQSRTGLRCFVRPQRLDDTLEVD
jgi:hypothetical protein